MPLELRRYLTLLFATIAVVALGCGEKPEEGTTKGDRDSVVASPADDAGVKSATITMSRRMTEVVDKVRSVDDAAAAERSLSAIVDDYIAAISPKVSDANLLAALEKDRGVKQASQQLKDALDSLQARAPDAAALVRSAIVSQSGRIYAIGRGGISNDEIEKMMERDAQAQSPPSDTAADSGAR